jgi:hypothetical protein
MWENVFNSINLTKLETSHWHVSLRGGFHVHWDSYNGGYGVGWGIISTGNAGEGNAGETGKILGI